MATTLKNLAKMTVTGAAGTGTITLNAAVGGYLTAAQAGFADAQTVVYEAIDTAGAVREIGTATYNAGAQTLTSRSCRNSTNGNALVSLTSSAIIAFSAGAEDILNKTGDTMTGKLGLAASTTAGASTNIPAGTAPTAPVDGDIWASTIALFARVASASRNIALSTTTLAGYGITDADPLGKFPGYTLSTANLTLTATNAGELVAINLATTNAITIPTATVSTFAKGAIIDLFQYGAGQTTIILGSTATMLLRSDSSKAKLSGQYVGAALTHLTTSSTSADEWLLVGSLST